MGGKELAGGVGADAVRAGEVAEAVEGEALKEGEAPGGVGGAGKVELHD